MSLAATSRGSDTVMGNKIVKYFNLDFDGVTGGAVATGLNNVEFAIFVPNTTEEAALVYLNSASASSVEDDLGSVYIDGVTSDDTGYLRVEGH